MALAFLILRSGSNHRERKDHKTQFKEMNVKGFGRVAQMGSFQKKIVPKLAMMW